MVQVNLLIALRVLGLKQKDFAKLVGQHPSVISRVITGVYNLNRDQEEIYANALGVPRDELFNSPN